LNNGFRQSCRTIRIEREVLTADTKQNVYAANVEEFQFASSAKFSPLEFDVGGSRPRIVSIRIEREVLTA